MIPDTAIKVLSIDPAKSPSASLNPEITLRFLRRRGIAKNALSARNARVAESVFGTNASQSKSLTILLCRSALGLSLLVIGLLSIFSIGSLGIELFPTLWMIGVAFFLFSGTLNRPVAIISSVVFLISMLLSAGTLPTIIYCVSITSFISLAVTGPGRFSVDRKLQRKLKNRLIANETVGRGLDDYRAFSRL